MTNIFLTVHLKVRQLFDFFKSYSLTPTSQQAAPTSQQAAPTNQQAE